MSDASGEEDVDLPESLEPEPESAPFSSDDALDINAFIALLQDVKEWKQRADQGAADDARREKELDDAFAAGQGARAEARDVLGVEFPNVAVAEGDIGGKELRQEAVDEAARRAVQQTRTFLRLLAGTLPQGQQKAAIAAVADGNDDQLDHFISEVRELHKSLVPA